MKYQVRPPIRTGVRVGSRVRIELRGTGEAGQPTRRRLSSETGHRGGKCPAKDERMTKRPDRRVHRTKRRLKEALLTLITRQDYEEISIQDITDLAEVGR